MYWVITNKLIFQQQTQTNKLKGSFRDQSINKWDMIEKIYNYKQSKIKKVAK